MSAVAATDAVSGAARRWRAGARSAVVVLAAAVSLVLLNVIAEKRSVRLDVTATREHELSPRTLRLLERLGSDPYEVVVAARFTGTDARVDRRARERVGEVLEQFGRYAPGVKATMIDTARPEGADEFAALLGRLAERDAGAIKAQAQAVEAGCVACEGLAAYLEGLADSLGKLREGLPGGTQEADAARAYFERRAGECRSSARALRDQAGKARQAMRAPPGDLPVPDGERAAAPMRDNLKALEAGLADIAGNLDLFAKAERIPAAARDAARPMALDAARQRDKTAVARDALERVGVLDLVRVAGERKSDASVLVIGPPGKGLTAVEVDALFPDPALLEAGTGMRTDLRRGGEEMFATALAALAEPVKPVLVLVHGEAGRLLGPGSEFQWAASRLALRGIDIVEWATAIESEPPTSRFAAGRPIVYATLPPDTSQAAGARGGGSGAERAVRLGRALDGLIDGGKNVLISAGPSTLPSYGEADPTVACLAKLGMKAGTARPLLRDSFVQGKRVAEFGQGLLPLEGEDPILRAVRGLNTHFDWPIGLEETGTADHTRLVPLFRVDDPRTWGEADWLGYWQVPPAQRGAVLDPPEGGSARDDRKGSWVLAMAAERTLAGAARPQRVIVVGSVSWFRDWVTRAGVTMVDGRFAPANPGNLELLEASIYWLAGRDEMIGQSATARAVPLIAGLSPGTLSALRWLVAAGMPALVLLAGAAWRLARG